MVDERFVRGVACQGRRLSSCFWSVSATGRLSGSEGAVLSRLSMESETVLGQGDRQQQYYLKLLKSLIARLIERAFKYIVFNKC